MTPSDPRQKRYSAPALEKGLDILEILAESRTPLTQVELGQRLGRSQTEFYRMLTCLEQRGYVQRLTNSGAYRLTLRLYELGHKENSAALIRNAAQLPMEELAESTGFACHLSVVAGASLLVLLERMPIGKVCLVVGEGRAQPLNTNSGKLLLGHMPPENAEQLINRDLASFSNPTEKKRFAREIRQFGKVTYTVQESQHFDGVLDLITLTGLPDTETVGALSMPMFTGKHNSVASTERYLESVKQCAQKINERLGLRA